VLHAALKSFPYQLTPEHCKPITSCCHHPCKIYIYTAPAKQQKAGYPNEFEPSAPVLGASSNEGLSAGATPAVTGNGGYWKEYDNIDMCRQGDVESKCDWRSNTSIEELKRTVETKNYSSITVSNGHPSFGHAALKNFPYQLTPEQCKPISSCCHHPCKIYIYTPPAHQQKPQAPRPGEAFDGMISTSDIQGCWACACVPGGCACLTKRAQGQDRLFHAGVVFLFFGLPCPFSEPRVRHPGTNGFYKEGEPNNVDFYPNSRCASNGASCSIKLW